MFGLRQRLEAWRGRASQPRDPNQTRIGTPAPPPPPAHLPVPSSPPPQLS
jgi:hypothetical protein